MLMQRRISAFFTAVRPNQSTDESLSRDPNNNENDKCDNSSASERDQDETERSSDEKTNMQKLNDLMIFKG